MILQALNRYYDILLKDPDIEIAPFGYSTVGVSFALNISAEGELLDVLPLFAQEQRGKKTVEVPRPMVVPAAVKRSVNVAANFLWDNVDLCAGHLGPGRRQAEVQPGAVRGLSQVQQRSAWPASTASPRARCWLS